MSKVSHPPFLYQGGGYNKLRNGIAGTYRLHRHRTGTVHAPGGIGGRHQPDSKIC